MRFLVVFVAVLGFASASVIAPLVYGANAGDVQAAVIDANVALRDNVRAIGESQARAAEAAIEYNNEANRQVIEASRQLNQDVYWGNVAANQNAIAAAQNIVAARGVGVVAPLGYAAPLGLGYAPYGLGYRAW